MAKILVIDDDANILLSTRRLLESDGHECVTAGNGQEALEYVKQNRFALLITDMRLPDMNGLSLVRELKKVEPSMPVILITAYASCESAVESVKRGVYEYLVKPFQADELLATVKRALGANMDGAGDS
ncbi:MAG: response regulator [Kiritimatiellia bacterium]|mgnify:CR=1 FL=1|nr:response regulator [Kiritimatiellia bacterium]